LLEELGIKAMDTAYKPKNALERCAGNPTQRSLTTQMR